MYVCDSDSLKLQIATSKLSSHSCRTALFFDLYALPFDFSEIYLLSTVLYCAFSQIIPRKVYLGLAKKAVTFFLFIFWSSPINRSLLTFLKIYQSKLPSLSHRWIFWEVRGVQPPPYVSSNPPKKIPTPRPQKKFQPPPRLRGYSHEKEVLRVSQSINLLIFYKKIGALPQVDYKVINLISKVWK